MLVASTPCRLRLRASSAVLVVPGASAFVPHLCSLVAPAGSLDPRALRQRRAFIGFALPQNPVVIGGRQAGAGWVIMASSNVRRNFHRQMHSGNIGRIYDRYAIRLPSELAFRYATICQLAGELSTENLKQLG